MFSQFFLCFWRALNGVMKTVASGLGLWSGGVLGFTIVPLMVDTLFLSGSERIDHICKNVVLKADPAGMLEPSMKVTYLHYLSALHHHFVHDLNWLKNCSMLILGYSLPHVAWWSYCNVAIYRHNADSERITPPTQRTTICSSACVRFKSYSHRLP